MHDTTSKDMLTDLGRRLISGSLSDTALQEATERTPNFAILPWVNVVKIGGQSIMDRGRVAVRNGRLHVAPGSGRFLPRTAGEAAQPLGRPSAEFAGSGPASRASAA